MQVQETYRYLPRNVVNEYVKLCSACNLRKPQATKPPLKPIIANGFFSRLQVSLSLTLDYTYMYMHFSFASLQIDLIDMRHLPDDNYKWILHGVDHWSKFRFAYPLVNKSASDVATALEKYIFPIMGLPSILQSDNGREFINQLIKSVVETWPGQVQFISGRPRHPKSQGLVEQAHYSLERMLSAKIAEYDAKTPPWSDWLPQDTCGKVEELFIYCHCTHMHELSVTHYLHVRMYIKMYHRSRETRRIREGRTGSQSKVS